MNHNRTLLSVVVAVGLVWFGSPNLHGQMNSASTVSAATFSAGQGIPRGSLATTFTDAPVTNLQETATEIPLPIRLGGVTIQIIDANGGEGYAGLVFAAGNQLNWVFPEWPALGPATVIFRSDDGSEVVETIEVVDVAPALFQVNSGGVAAGAYVKRGAAEDQSDLLHLCPPDVPDCVQNPVPVPGDGEEVFISFFGSGFRFATNVRAFAGDTELTVLGASAQGSFEGLDQVNVGVGPEVRGKVDQKMRIEADGLTSNEVLVTFGPAPAVISSIAPAVASPGSTTAHSISGARLHEAANVVFEPANGLTVENLQGSYSELTFDLTVSEGAALGPRTFSVRGPDGDSLPAGFEILEKPPGPSMSNFQLGGAGLILTQTGGVINVRELSFDFTDDDGDIINPDEDFSVAPRAGVANLEIRIIDGARSCFAFNGTTPFLHRPGELSGRVDSVIPILVQATQPTTLGTQAQITLIDASGKRSETIVVEDPIIGCRGN